MSYCAPCPPCDTEYPLLCEPLETTANGKRLVVEDSAACQKTIQSPVAQQVLKTDGANNLTWTNGGNSTVLGKDAAGLVEFATINSVLQAGPVDLGSQPLTTTGAVSTGALTSTSLTSTGTASVASLASTGAVTAKTIAITNPSATTALTINQSLAGNGVVINSVDGTSLSIQSTNTNPIRGGTLDFFPTTGGDIVFDGASDGIFVFNNNSSVATKATAFTGANFGISTTTPAKTLHVNGTVRLQGLPTYANNAAAISGGLVADDVYKTSTGELRIVV